MQFAGPRAATSYAVGPSMRTVCTASLRRRRGKQKKLGFEWLGFDWIGLDWVRLDWIGLEWIGFDWVGRVGLDRGAFDCIGVRWVSVCRIDFNRIAWNVIRKVSCFHACELNLNGVK